MHQGVVTHSSTPNRQGSTQFNPRLVLPPLPAWWQQHDAFQPIRLERAVQTSDPATGTWSDGNDSKGHKGFTARKLLLQEIFKTARQQKELDASNVIEFSVYGKKGIRLSDASEGNWGGFEGRDDRSLFGENRLQIMVRLHVRIPTIFHASHR